MFINTEIQIGGDQLKKTIAIICLLITFFIIYFLQANFFSWFTISDVKPNLFIIFVLFIGLFAGKKIGVVLGLFFGVYLDLLIGRTIGISGIMFALIGLIGEYLDKNFSKESRVTIMLMVIGATVVYEVGEYVFDVIRLGLTIEIISFLKILIIETIYNVIIVVIIYPIMQKLGYALENTFKIKNILTRYF